MGSDFTPLLAAAAKAQDWSHILHGAGLILIVIAVGIGLLCLLKRLKRTMMSATMQRSEFSMEQLERFYQDGKLEEQEFKRLRRVVLGLGEPLGNSDNTLSSAPPPVDDAIGSDGDMTLPQD